MANLSEDFVQALFDLMCNKRVRLTIEGEYDDVVLRLETWNGKAFEEDAELWEEDLNDVLQKFSDEAYNVIGGR